MKNVYLFELDSVRKTNEEIIVAQKALYEEIVINGNTVILTYNQLVDSLGFFSLLDEKEYYDSIIKLFEAGRIQVSQFGDIRNITQYLLRNLARDKEFIFSALPIKCNQRRLVALVRRSLELSDLSEIYDYYTQKTKKDEELYDLFTEVISEKEENCDEIRYTEEKTKLNKEDMLNIVENLYWLLKTIIRLSTMHNIYVSPRTPEEYSNLKLVNFIDSTVNANESISENIGLWSRAVEIIKSLSSYAKRCNDRSVYLHELKKKYEESAKERREHQYAEVIIDLCYNYACESSICNISKHYDTKEISEKKCINKSTSYFWDFKSRLATYWRNGKNADKRFLTEENNHFIEFPQVSRVADRTLIIKAICKDFVTAARIMEYVKYIEVQKNDEIHRYEFDLKKHQKKHKKKIVISLMFRLFTIIIFMFAACLAELLSNGIQDILGSNNNKGFISAVVTLFFLFLTELFTAFLQKKHPKFMTLSDALEGFVYFCKDMFLILKSKSKTHYNEFKQDVDYAEKKNNETPIDVVMTGELSRYLKFFNEQKESPFFSYLSEYPICDIEQTEKIKALLRDEELYNRRYGVIYQSSFNTLIVDPIEKDGHYFSYERIMPSSMKSGITIIVKHDNKFVLLKQSRHALRRAQYGFVRGFSECGDPIEDVKRELKEELSVSEKDFVSQPKRIGQITPDSGLTTSETGVYLVNISHFSPQIGHEGITEVFAITDNQLERWIRENRIDDGFTIAAYLLYKSKEETILTK